MKELITRTITALVVLVAVFFIIKFVPLLYFSAVLFIVVTIAALEFMKLAAPRTSSKVVVILSGAVAALSFTFAELDLLAAVMIVLLVNGLFFLFAVRQKEKLASFVRDFGIHLLAVFYVYIPLYFIFELKRLGPHYLFFLIVVIAVGDSAAYFFGKALGKHKIYPVASPNKSLEGLIAAVLFAAFSGWWVLLLFPVDIPVKVWLAVATGAVMGLFSQLSDPVESLFKRAARKKDSGALLPGHGGVLDRLDSYIFCAPVLFYIITYLWG